MSQVQQVNTTYEPFSVEPIYIEANRAFVCRQDLGNVRRYLDLACGTGTVSEILLSQSPTAHLNGVDYDPVQIDLITERFTKQGYACRRGFDITTDTANGKPVLTFAVGSADVLPFPENTFDCVTIANAIHMLPDKKKLLDAIFRVLKPGGRFGFNSTFYAGSMPKGTDRIYMDWLRMAIQHISEKSAKLVAEGKPGIQRKHGTTRGAFQNKWATPTEWSAILAASGLKTIDSNERMVDLDERCFALVGAYGGLAEVLLSGYPVDAASEALQACAGPSMAANQATSVPRLYLEMWAVKG